MQKILLSLTLATALLTSNVIPAVSVERVPESAPARNTRAKKKNLSFIREVFAKVRSMRLRVQATRFNNSNSYYRYMPESRTQKAIEEQLETLARNPRDPLVRHATVLDYLASQDRT